MPWLWLEKIPNKTTRPSPTIFPTATRATPDDLDEEAMHRLHTALKAYMEDSKL